MSDDPEYLSALAHFAADTPRAAIPDDLRERACTMLADCVGCMVAGARMPELRGLIACMASRAATPQATVIGTPLRLPVESAAFAGGTAGTWHDLDEGNLHTRTHAAIQIVPAALADAELAERSGPALIDALVLAYEVSSRLWRATDARLAVHPHGTYGPLAAAVALCRLRGDDPCATRHAMNIAMTLGIAASRQTLGDGATVRNVYTGHSARAGFEALMLRDLGFSAEHDAPRSILGNLYGSAFDPGAAVEELGDRWWMRKNYFKRFASGRYAHAALDAMELLIERLGDRLRAEAIQRIEVETFFMAATLAQRRVDTPFGMRFSIPAALACRIVRGPQPPDDDGARAFTDPRVHALAERIVVSEDPGATAAYPARQPTRMTVTFTDGQQETVSVERILGESDNPLSVAQLGEKFEALAAPAFGTEGARAAFSALCSVGTCDNLRTLTQQLREAAASSWEVTP